MLKHLTFARVAAAFVLLQIVVSAIAIVAYTLIRPDWACDGTGLLTETFRASFPIPPDNTSAKAMFDCLFVPLSYPYILSMAVLLLVIPWKIGAIMRAPKIRWALIGGIILSLGGSYALLFSPTDYAMASSVKRQIIDGSVFGYINVFCVMAFFIFLIFMALPNERWVNPRPRPHPR